MQTLWPTDNLKKVLDKFNTQIPDFSTLSNGLKLYHPWHLDGGGGDYRQYFLTAVKSHGKNYYKHAYEWCCGHSIIGFEILTNGICDNLSLSDYYDLAVEISLDNAQRLGYADKVKGYITPIISSIPHTEQFDLVIGNPPNSMNGDGFISAGKLNGYKPEHILHELRIGVDDNFETHKEFFANIRNYITDDADIFLTIHSTMITMVKKDLSDPAGLEIKNVIDMMPRDPDLKIVHFKIQ